jgi:hypothetical protein
LTYQTFAGKNAPLYAPTHVMDTNKPPLLPLANRSTATTHSTDTFARVNQRGIPASFKKNKKTHFLPFPFKGFLFKIFSFLLISASFWH